MSIYLFKPTNDIVSVRPECSEPNIYEGEECIEWVWSKINMQYFMLYKIISQYIPDPFDTFRSLWIETLRANGENSNFIA